MTPILTHQEGPKQKGCLGIHQNRASTGARFTLNVLFQCVFPQPCHKVYLMDGKWNWPSQLKVAREKMDAEIVQEHELSFFELLLHYVLIVSSLHFLPVDRWVFIFF